jgi:hypothetical protein
MYSREDLVHTLGTQSVHTVCTSPSCSELQLGYPPHKSGGRLGSWGSVPCLQAAICYSCLIIIESQLQLPQFLFIAFSSTTVETG